MAVNDMGKQEKLPDMHGTKKEANSTGNPNKPAVIFSKAYPNAPDIQPANKSACGSMPSAAFQYCEALRQASSLGWHVYPPKDLHLLFDGHEVFYHEDGQWYPMKSANFEEDFRNHWKALAPEELEEFDPPYLSEIFIPGIVQIWSGYFVQTRPGVHLLIRPPVNYAFRSSFTCYEGLVQTDSFCPMPLFINIKLTATNREIFIPSFKPLFQVMAVPEEISHMNNNSAEHVELDKATRDEFDWENFKNTIRDSGMRDSHRPGRYAASARKNNSKGRV